MTLARGPFSFLVTAPVARCLLRFASHPRARVALRAWGFLERQQWSKFRPALIFQKQGYQQRIWILRLLLQSSARRQAVMRLLSDLLQMIPRYQISSRKIRPYFLDYFFYSVVVPSSAVPPAAGRAPLRGAVRSAELAFSRTSSLLPDNLALQ
jgi:hypothetical protein